MRHFDRNSAFFNFCILVVNVVNLISGYKKVKSWFDNYCSGRSCNIQKGGFYFTSLAKECSLLRYSNFEAVFFLP